MKQYQIRNLFFKSCENGDLETVRHLLEFHPDFIAVRDQKLRSGLFIACENDHIELVEFLLNKRADTNIPDDDNYTALISACEDDKPELVELLIYHGANLYQQRWHPKFNWGNGSAAQMCILYGDNDAWKVVEANIADVSYQNKYGETGLILASKNNVSDIETILDLIEAGADLNLRDNSGLSALNYMIENSDLKIKALGERLMLSQIVDEQEDEVLGI
jgi:ankyrin repeat protein